MLSRPSVLALAALALAACKTTPRWDPHLTDVPSPAAPGSAEPQLTTFQNRAILSWIERAGDHATLKFAERTSQGWSAPQAVASGDDWFVNWADVPSVARVQTGLLAAHWLQSNGPDPEGYDVRLSLSRDDGKTWSAPVSPHHDATPTEHGFATLYPVANGLGLIWLDGRAGETMAIRAATFAPEGNQTSETLIDDRVCECCPTAAAVTSEGIVAVYRDRSRDEVRNIAVARFADGAWTTPAAVHDDDWRIDACPVNGPSVSAEGLRVVVAWFNAKVDQGHVFVAFSTDGGKTFGDPIRVDDAAALGRAQVVLLADGSVAAAWIEYADGKSQLRLRRITSAGSRSESLSVSPLAAGRASGTPRLARVGDELLLAWTESQEGATRVRTGSIGLR